MDPYKILNVSPNATDEEIKKAYRDLARKYHPDNYTNNPLSDLAEEKMKEINDAYDMIMKARASGSQTGASSYSSYGNGSASYQQSYGSTGSGQYAVIRNLIYMGNVERAEALLSSIQTRDAEWHFLMGCVYNRKGWFDEAKRHFETACSMNPNNLEYANALRRMSASGDAYRTYGVNNAEMCDCCTSLMCMRLCCFC